MSLRIEFSAADLAKITISRTPDPFWEVLLALHLINARPVSAAFQQWTGPVPITTATKRLLALAPPRGYSPDFLTPAEGAGGVDAGIDAIMSTPRSQLRREIGKLQAGRSATGSWLGDLADGDKAALGGIAKAIRDFHRAVLEPRWQMLQATVASDRARRAETLMNRGIAGLFDALHPSLRWRPPVLELTGQHVDGELRLAGRGLRLIPSFFCYGAPTVLEDDSLPPVLVYPVNEIPGWLEPVGEPDDRTALVALLGPTRAKVLVAAADGCTTTELGRRAGISPASASYHATVLREAGLVTTRRNGMSVRHDLTALGLAVLDRRLPN
ncbi:ArsR/SmtB family transcription factor [Fodinicola acaciae]|uniref:ArsR/SmtB family transcription factor n=1 Tax=Fodinicola acaciae TaxID=2681555 RepID=UPI0013D51EC3|nr:helix-turn-helix domain-containing protein [Fodinicola acaciae]